jgi:hypothetical protein
MFDILIVALFLFLPVIPVMMLFTIADNKSKEMLKNYDFLDINSYQEDYRE